MTINNRDANKRDDDLDYLLLPERAVIEKRYIRTRYQYKFGIRTYDIYFMANITIPVVPGTW